MLIWLQFDLGWTIEPWFSALTGSMACLILKTLVFMVHMCSYNSSE